MSQYGLLFLLAGCATPFAEPPALDQVCVRVRWSTPDEIAARCGSDKLACATVGSKAFPNSTIWAPKPEGFDDPKRLHAWA